MPNIQCILYSLLHEQGVSYGTNVTESVFLPQEFLAFSSRPVTLEDILRVEGREVEGREVEGREEKVEGTKVKETRVEEERDTQFGVKESSKSNQKVVFLSTWSADKNTLVCNYGQHTSFQ